MLPEYTEYNTHNVSTTEMDGYLHFAFCLINTLMVKGLKGSLWILGDG